MRAINKPILQIVAIPVAAPAVLGVEAFPVVTQFLDLAPFQAEEPVLEDVEIHRQATQVLGVEGFGQAFPEEAFLFLRGAPGVPKAEAVAKALGIEDQPGDV